MWTLRITFTCWWDYWLTIGLGQREHVLNDNIITVLIKKTLACKVTSTPVNNHRLKCFIVMYIAHCCCFLMEFKESWKQAKSAHTMTSFINGLKTSLIDFWLFFPFCVCVCDYFYITYDISNDYFVFLNSLIYSSASLYDKRLYFIF